MSDSSNPLDALEKLLSDAPSTKPLKAKKKTKEELEAERQAKLAQIEEQERQQDLIDQERLKKQQQAMASIKQSKAYQAMVEQEQEALEVAEEKSDALEGFEVIQLTHTKI